MFLTHSIVLVSVNLPRFHLYTITHSLQWFRLANAIFSALELPLKSQVTRAAVDEGCTALLEKSTASYCFDDN